jgi:hypothetical protein
MPLRRVWPLALILLQPLQADASTLTLARANAFVRALVSERDSLESFVWPADLALSKRLGIRYEGVDHKFLISYDLDPLTRSSLKESQVRHSIRTIDPEHDIAQLDLAVPGQNVPLTFLFEDSLLISPITHYTRSWTILESAHFRFLISDTTSFNSYCIASLERFFDHAAGLLGLSDEDRATIATHKLYYCLCANDEESKRLIGAQALGSCNLAYDCIVTTYNAHYHELVHELVNFKFRTLPLFTHPFLQEGLAVAMGGRGGKEPGPILDLGRYLCAGGILDYHALLSTAGFGAVDASMSYPLSGLYNRFLLESLGTERYLDLYRRYSGSASEVQAMQIKVGDLPSDSAWQAFVSAKSSQWTIQPGCEGDAGHLVLETPEATITVNDDRYCFTIRDTILLVQDTKVSGVRSKQFETLLGTRPYGGEKYAVVADSQEISVYNLYTNNLIAKFVGDFADPPMRLAAKDGWYRFSVLKAVFEEDL